MGFSWVHEEPITIWNPAFNLYHIVLPFEGPLMVEWALKPNLIGN